MKPPSLGVPCRPGSKAATAVSERATVKASQTPATFDGNAYRERRALAWLHETGEHRPAIEILESGANLSSEFRRALAKWIKDGCKRRRGATVHPEPRKALPPAMAKKMLLGTPKQRRANWLCVQWEMSNQKRDLCALHGPEKARAALVGHVVDSLGVGKRQAEKWVALFYRDESDAPR